MNGSTAAAIKVGTIAIATGAFSSANLALVGADALAFELVGNDLYLKAGTKLDFESGKTRYSVAVTVDDPATAGAPDVTSATYTLHVTDVSPERLMGTSGADVRTGGSDIDLIFGLSGNDNLSGLGNNDVLTGGRGRDIMRGGAGADDFDFNHYLESGKTATTRDIIVDFRHNIDDIDLRTIDANGAAAGNTAFRFLATKGAAFTGVAGQLHWFQVNNTGTANDWTIAEGDINGDRIADFQIALKGLISLTAGDFIL